MNQIFTLEHLNESISSIASRIRKQDFLTYFKKFSLLESSETRLVLGVVSSFHKDNLTRKFADDILAAVRSVMPSIESIELMIDDTIESRTDAVIDCREIERDSAKQTRREQVE
jgi:chromosomal replication initiation ATPase DnaA